VNYLARTMRDWVQGRRSAQLREPAATGGPAPKPRRALSGKYESLYTYLEGRYADTVVLTFSEIEDLLGFTLPDLARQGREWWTDAEKTAGGDHHADAWILASRTAAPNLLAATVVFERGGH